jgi:hypothetical protein
MQEILEIRESSPLFSLETAADVQDRVAFHNTGPGQIPGLIVMSLSDLVGDDLDPELEEIVVLFNASDDPQDFVIPASAGREWELHPVQQGSADPVVVTSAHDLGTGAFSVPARTTAVFVTDITPPEVDASLDFVRGGKKSAWFEVGYSCTDASAVTVEADINGIPVIDGEEAHLVVINPNGTPRWIRDGSGRLTIWDFDFLMTVTCEDASGNTTTETVEPEFRRKKTRTPAYRREIGAFAVT